MNILNLSLDKKVLDKESRLAKIILEYAELVDKYLVIVPSAERSELTLSNKVIIFGSGGGNKLISLFRIFCLANKLIKKEKISVITVQDQYYLASIGLGLSKKFKIGLEVQVHGFERYNGLRKIIAKFILPRADSIRAVSERLRIRLINEFGVDEKRITVVPIFVDTNLSLRDAPPAGRGGRGNFIFLTVGRLVPVKNIGLQIEAMAEVVKKYLNCELWVVGDGPERERLEKLSYALCVTSYVKFLGWRSDMSKYYEEADVFMLTSDAEGWPLVIVEAAGYGLPIIMTDVGSAGELIIDGESGIVIPVGDKEKLAGAMIKIIEDENLRKKIGANALLAVRRLPNKGEILGLYKKSWDKALSVIPA